MAREPEEALPPLPPLPPLPVLNAQPACRAAKKRPRPLPSSPAADDGADHHGDERLPPPLPPLGVVVPMALKAETLGRPRVREVVALEVIKTLLFMKQQLPLPVGTA